MEENRDGDGFNKTAREFLWVLCLAVVLALSVNWGSPAGIPLQGMWDSSRGMVSAYPEKSLAYSGFEIRDVRVAKKIFDEGRAVFVDARSAEAYGEGHIPGAVSLPRGEVEDRLGDFLDGHAGEGLLVLYCSGRDCEDSHVVAEFLQGLGLTNIKVFSEGFAGWKQGGFSVEK